MLATGQRPPRLVLYRNILLFLVVLGALVVASLMVILSSVQRQPIRLHIGSDSTQGVGACWLVSEVDGVEWAAASTNRIALMHTSRCAYCSLPRSVPGDTRYRVSLFVDPCPLAPFLP